LLGILFSGFLSGFLYFFVWYIYCCQFHFWGYAGLGHEALHGRVFSSRNINKALFFFCSALTWNNGELFKESHLIHHKETFSDRDFESLSETKWDGYHILLYSSIDFKKLIRKLHFTFINALGFYPNYKPLSISAVIFARRIILFNAGLYACLVYFTGDVATTSFVALAPFTGSIFNKLLAQSQHFGLRAFKDHGALVHSRSLDLPAPLQLLYANMNYHAEHHFAPNVPYYKLPALRLELLKLGAIQPVKLAYFFKMFWYSRTSIRTKDDLG